MSCDFHCCAFALGSRGAATIASTARPKLSVIVWCVYWCAGVAVVLEARAGLALCLWVDVRPGALAGWP